MPLGIDGGIAARFFDNPLFKISLQGGPNAGLYLIRPAAAVQSLKYNEFALFHTPTSFCFSPQYSKISPPGQDQGGNWGDNLKIPLQYRAKIGMI